MSEEEILEAVLKSHPRADLRVGTTNRAMCLKIASIVDQIDDVLPGCTDLARMLDIRARLVRLPSIILSFARYSSKRKGISLE